jgi:hypothetical protein
MKFANERKWSLRAAAAIAFSFAYGTNLICDHLRSHSRTFAAFPFPG